MEYKDYIKQGLNGNSPLKLILCGNVQGTENDKVGVVSVVYATNDKDLAEKQLHELTTANPDNYYIEKLNIETISSTMESGRSRLWT